MENTAGFVLLGLLALVVCTTAAPDCLDSYTDTECMELTNVGGGRLVLNSLTDPSQLTDDMQVKLKTVVANVSDEYVIVHVEPKHIVITKIDSTPASDGKVVVHFFVVNPTGSVVMPVAFRSYELYLMLNLNKDKMEKELEYEVTALEPGNDVKLPIPTWALAVIIYAALVIVIGLVYIGTKDIRRQWSEAHDSKLRKAVLGDGDMEIDPESGKAGPGDSVELNGSTPAKMYRDTQVSFGVQATKEDIAATLGITYATVEGENKTAPETGPEDSPPPEKSVAPPAYDDATAASDQASQSSASSSDTTPIAGQEAPGDSTEAEATAALDGAVNVAFEGDGNDEEPEDQTTSL